MWEEEQFKGKHPDEVRSDKWFWWGLLAYLILGLLCIQLNQFN